MLQKHNFCIATSPGNFFQKWLSLKKVFLTHFMKCKCWMPISKVNFDFSNSKHCISMETKHIIICILCNKQIYQSNKSTYQCLLPCHCWLFVLEKEVLWNDKLHQLQFQQEMPLFLTSVHPLHFPWQLGEILIQNFFEWQIFH